MHRRDEGEVFAVNHAVQNRSVVSHRDARFADEGKKPRIPREDDTPGARHDERPVHCLRTAKKTTVVATTKRGPMRVASPSAKRIVSREDFER